jgi:hypothetical protein
MLTTGSAIDDGDEYSSSLLRERQRELLILERKHRDQQIQTTDYLSCRRSLLQAIGELANLVRRCPPSDPDHSTNSIDSGGSPCIL